MANTTTGEGDAKARLPEMEVTEGQEHGYVGDVDVIPADEQTGVPTGGSSNVEPTAETTTEDASRRTRTRGG